MESAASHDVLDARDADALPYANVPLEIHGDEPFAERLLKRETRIASPHALADQLKASSDDLDVLL